MELTKKDREQIARDVDAIGLIASSAASEYAKLYEATFYEELIKKLEAKRDVLDYVHDHMLNKRMER